MKLFKPCPPCCTAGATYPDIFVPDDFWDYSISQKKALLKTIKANRTDLTVLDDQIATLQSGTDLVQGV